MPLGASHSVTDIESGANPRWDPAPADSDSSETEDTEVIVEKVEQPGLDSLRGTFGTIGTIIRNRRRTALAEAQERGKTRNRRGSEVSGLASQSINEEPRQPGEERDVEKLDLGRRYFGSGTRKHSGPVLPDVPQRTHLQGAPPILFPPSPGHSTEQPAPQSSPDSEKSDPLSTSPRRPLALHAHFDPNQQPPSSRTQESPPSTPSNNPASRVDRPGQGREKSSI